MGRLGVLLKRRFLGATRLRECGEELVWLIDFRGGAPSGLLGIMAESP